MKKEFIVPNMMCNNCVMHLENLEVELAGVTKAQANLFKHLLVVEFNTQVIEETEIKKAILKKGYSISE